MFKRMTCLMLVVLVLGLAHHGLGAMKVVIVTNNPADEATYTPFLTDLLGSDTMVEAVKDKYVDPLSEVAKADLSAADLIIVSRRTSSGKFVADIKFWNGLAAPVVLHSSFLIGDDRWRWMPGGTENADVTTVGVVAATDLVFNGVPVTDGQVKISETALPGLDVSNQGSVGNGTKIATPAGSDRVMIARWAAGTEYYPGSGYIAGGPRLFFGMRTDQFLPFINDKGKKMLENAILSLYKIGTAPYFVDDFATPVDYVIDGPGAYNGILDANNILALNASISRLGALFMQTANGSWDPGPGPMLYKTVTGDFVATVKVTDFAGAMGAQLEHNDSGIGARDPNGATVNWVSVNYFPTGTAFLARSTKNGVRDELGQTAGIWAGVDTYALAAQYPYIQLERRGSKFYPRISADGETFIPLTTPPYKGIYNANDPNQAPLVIDRTDLPATLQVGLLQCTYSPTAGYAAFDDFKIEVPVLVKIVNPSFEADGMVIQGGTPKGWAGNLPANSGVSTGASATDGTYFFWQGNGSVLYQTTSEVITAEGVTYTLQADVRNSSQGSPKIALYYEDEAGGPVELGSASLPANGDTWLGPVAIDVIVKTTAASVGKRLGVELSLANYPGNFWSEFDNIRVTRRP